MYDEPTVFYVGCGSAYGSKLFSVNVNTGAKTLICTAGNQYDYRVNEPTIDTTNKIITISQNAGTSSGCSAFTQLPIDINSAKGIVGGVQESFNFNSIGYSEVAWFVMLGHWCTKIYRIDLTTGQLTILLESGPYHSRFTSSYDHSIKTLSINTSGLQNADGLYFVCGY